MTARDYGAELTAREKLILALIADGLEGDQVAARIGPSPRNKHLGEFSRRAIYSHMKNISIKLGADNSAHAVALAHLRDDLHPIQDIGAAPELTTDQRRLLEMVCAGMSNPEIAKVWGISPGKISERHVVLCWQLGAKNRPNAVHRAISYDLVTVGRYGLTCR